MDTALYYRISDGLVVGSTTSPGEVNAEQELSHYGSGHGYVKGNPVDMSGKIRRVVGGKVITEPDPASDKIKLDRKNGMGKAVQKLGLSQDEAKALFGG